MKKRSRGSRKGLRILVLGLLGLLVVCAGPLVAFVWINASLPQDSSEPERLSTEQAALMDEALHLKAELGDQVWPGFGQAAVPILAWNEAYAFLCAHPQPPAGWDMVDGVQVAGQPCYRMEWQDGQNFTERIGEQWAGSLATREWGLISLRQQIAVSLPQPVRAAAPAFLLVDEMLRPYRYIGGELHEAFHAYQAVEMQPRFDDAQRAYPDGERYWEQDAHMNSAWEAEIEALYGAVYADSEAQARESARRFLEQRSDRRRQYLQNPQLVLYEQRFEWLEGLAKYVELHMLRAANETPGYQPVPGLLEATPFRGYEAIEQLYDQEMGQMRRQATVEGDSRFYYTGSAQAALLDRWMPDWKSRAGEPGVWIEDLLREALGL